MEPPGDPSLDFLSPSFDAARAIATPGLQPPDPDALPLDNVAKCRAILPAENPEALCHVVKKQASEASKLKASQFKERAARLTQRMQESCKMSLENVHKCVKPGPVRVLGQWLEAGLRVRVVTRHARGIRGVATGQLVSYDRFMNVVLKEVYEEYTVRVRVQRTRPAGDAPCIEGNAAAAAAAAGPGATPGPAAPSMDTANAPASRSNLALASAPAPLQLGSEASSKPAGSVGPGAAAGLASLPQSAAAAAARRPAGVVIMANRTSADEDPVEPGELGEVAVPAVKVREAFRQDHRRRHLAQIFIKGDSIVIISPEQHLTRVQPATKPRSSS